MLVETSLPRHRALSIVTGTDVNINAERAADNLKVPNGFAGLKKDGVDSVLLDQVL